MTTNVIHINPLIFQLKQQHAEKIDLLTKKIESLQKEIELLNSYREREFDC
jgi:hypothetical protein